MKGIPHYVLEAGKRAFGKPNYLKRGIGGELCEI